MGSKVSDWLLGVWEAAILARREAAWNALTTQVVDKILDGTHRVTAGDVDFLVARSKEDEYRTRVQAAVHVLSGIGEHSHETRGIWHKPIRLALESQLSTTVPWKRALLAEALWQMADLNSVPALTAARDREEVDAVKELLDHVLRCLERADPTRLP